MRFGNGIIAAEGIDCGNSVVSCTNYNKLFDVSIQIKVRAPPKECPQNPTKEQSKI